MDNQTSKNSNMTHIKGKDTSIELKVRKYLFANGYRFRKNDSRYPGKPDIVLPKYHSVIFINGCFWHRHPFCKYAQTPKNNYDFWQEKFRKNVENDKRHYKELEDMGWHVIVIWECELKKSCFEQTMKKVINELNEEYISNAVKGKSFNELYDGLKNID